MKKFGLAAVLLGLLVAVPGSLFADTSACADVENKTGIDVQVCFTVSGPDGVGNYELTIDTITGLEAFTIKNISSLGWNPVGNPPVLADFLNTLSGDTWVDFNQQPPAGFDPGTWATRIVGSPNPNNGGFETWVFDGDPGTDIVFHIQYNIGQKFLDGEAKRGGIMWGRVVAQHLPIPHYCTTHACTDAERQFQGTDSDEAHWKTYDTRR